MTPRSTFRDFVASRYDADPAGVGRVVLTSFKLIRIAHHAYRGYVKMAAVEVKIGDATVTPAAATRPSWKLVPAQVATETETRKAATLQVVESYCQLRRRDREQRAAAREQGQPVPPRRPSLFGDGVYMVDAGVLPRVLRLLRVAQGEYEAAFDRWATEDGYEEFKALLKEQMGETDYALAEALLPDRQAIRSRYSVDVQVLPFQLADEVPADPDAAAGRKFATVELLETVVRGPREDVAAAWRGLADRLAAPAPPDGRLVAVRTVRKAKDAGAPDTYGARTVKGLQLEIARRETEVFLYKKAGRTLDPVLAAAAKRVLAELPDTAEARSARAVDLNQDDAAAVRVAMILVAAAEAAEDESGMADGLTRALRGDEPLVPSPTATD